MLRRRLAGPGTPVDGPQPHDAHQPLHSLPAYWYTLPVQPGPHPPRPVEGGLQVLTVHLPHQGQVRFGSPLGTVVEAGTANSQQCALPDYRQGRMLPVHHLPTPARTHGPDLSAKKSRSTFRWPISWYNRAIRAASRSCPSVPYRCRRPRRRPPQGISSKLESVRGGPRAGRLVGPPYPRPYPPPAPPWP